MNCNWCGEPLTDTEEVELKTHRVCLFRMTMGSVAHFERRCSCYIPGSTEGDPEDLTRYQAAQKAAKLFFKPIIARAKAKLSERE